MITRREMARMASGWAVPHDSGKGNAAASNADAGAGEIGSEVESALAGTVSLDIHTHLFPPSFGKLFLWGIDEMLRYHYLVAELFRFSPMSPEEYWALPKSRQADLIWETLFVRNAPLSEATRGVVAVLHTFGLDTSARDLREAREFFATRDPERHVTRVFQAANVGEVVMTNDPFDPAEAQIWRTTPPGDFRFRAALRLDGLLNGWESAPAKMTAQGYRVGPELDSETIKAVRLFFEEWIARMHPLYMAVSLPSSFRYPEASARNKLLDEVVIPVCRLHGKPLALMIGVKRGVNPRLRDAGDGAGYADISSVEAMCRRYPEVRFLVSLLSRQNQHELCVAARKFGNLTPFGCWWFLNNPSIIAEITAERLEMLGTSFIAQHSDSRIFEQLIYKWKHSRAVVSRVLREHYEALAGAGRPVTKVEIWRDVERLMAGVFREAIVER